MKGAPESGNAGLKCFQSKVKKMPVRADAWISQADRDLQLARVAQKAGSHEWACFAAQQSAVKSVKALLARGGQRAVGQAVTKLLMDAPPRMHNQLIEAARILDTFQAVVLTSEDEPDGLPFERYGPLQSDQAIQHADEVLLAIRAELKGGPFGV